MIELEASVVVATRDRPADLVRCLEALRSQRTRRAFEVVVVDDGSVPPAVESDGLVHYLDSDGRGPARARNRGVRASQGKIIAFTDDDTVPDPGWLEAACSFLETYPECLGVEGPTISPTFDPLYEHSIENDRPGAYWTCNVAYRRTAIEQAGLFSEDFPFPHCEDLDLAFRVLELGPIGFSEEMRVLHRPRPVSIPGLIGRARLARSELLLLARHPTRYDPPFPRRLLPAVGAVRRWRTQLGRERLALLRRPRRLGRLGIVAAGQIGLSLLTVLRPDRLGAQRK